jgi:hypothetical protein
LLCLLFNKIRDFVEQVLPGSEGDRRDREEAGEMNGLNKVCRCE